MRKHNPGHLYDNRLRFCLVGSLSPLIRRPPPTCTLLKFLAYRNWYFIKLADSPQTFYRRVFVHRGARPVLSRGIPLKEVRHFLLPQKEPKMSRYFSNNTNSLNAAINVSYSYTIADDRSQTLTWLSPLNPKLRHQDVQERRVPNVGEWLLRTQEFESWCAGSEGSESDNAVLFCYGDPGVGKTYIRYSTKSEPRGMEEKWQELTSRDISSLVIDLLCDQARGQNAAVACFYCDFATQKEQSPTNMLGALLKQAVGGLEEVPVEIAQTYEDQGNVIGGRGPQLADIVKMLQITSSKKRTFICIDALDECLARYRVKVLDSLNQVLQKCPGTRIFITGRPHVQPEIAKSLPGRVKSVSITPRRDDIIGYLQTRLDEDTIPDAMDNCLEADILEKIPDNVSEMYVR